ncbi:oxygenase [Pseudomaricurvus alcaniphilus]|uniref:peroxidase family protein n=1 Tax=Pseudomaricurvus alcaniphilus TaxID=1166482 RepID=UPI00140C685E|nr:peroxidase family protein [Pseudomaricurvus alcaniphilus]NHN37668.1 oxygenase [Pseudomaricurvus alcaniphilus]
MPSSNTARRPPRSATLTLLITTTLLLASCTDSSKEELAACARVVKEGFREIADDRSERFQGKVQEDTARCRGGDKAVQYRDTPWVDWSNYWATGDASTKKEGSEAKTLLGEHAKPNGRGIDGSLIDLEYQRIELIKFNLFDNYTYESYIKGIGGKPGSTLKQWDAMRLPPEHPFYQQVGGSGPQSCNGELIRWRTLTGICNDVFNPLMGSSGTLFARNTQFESTFPRLGQNELTIARHSDPENGNRLGLLTPDPQLISRKLFTREQSRPDLCNAGKGLDANPNQAHCDYQKAPFFNVLAAFWIQFMTHDWFSHTYEGRNSPGLESVGCDEEAESLGCRPGDRREATLVAAEGTPGSFNHNGQNYQKRAYRTTANTITAWWDASQIYGHDAISSQRVLRDRNDPAKLWQPGGYLPLFSECQPDCPIQPQWQGQEVAAFPDNWNIGMSFYHNLFVREHNSVVDEFRRLQKAHPDRDSGLRNPIRPQQVLTYKDVSDEEIFQVARLVVAAEIAKIHTIEWTTQLLYDEPLYLGMNSNWFGLFNVEEDSVSQVLRKIFNRDENILSRTSAKLASLFDRKGEGDKSNALYSILASGAGIFGLNNKREEGMLWWKRDAWDLTDLRDVNGGVNHFGSPFNFPEEFTTVYRLHPLVPDLIEFRRHQDPNQIASKVPVVDTVRAGSSSQMRSGSLENWGLSMGRQRLGLLHLQNHPLFLQNLDMPHLDSPSGKLDIVALDIIRDRERGVPRFNEFRRQIGLRTLTSFDDFVDRRLPEDSAARQEQEKVVASLREVYGTHKCDASKIISTAQKNDDGTFINDCYGKPDGSIVDNIEDVDTVVGWLAEYTRPHGFAISETQFHIFILNASRRLFSDRFFTSSYRPEFYSHMGYDWVMNNGPLADCPYPLTEMKDDRKVCNEPKQSNGHDIAVSPLKRIMMRNIPQLRSELMHVVNVFDPWARDRGDYYSLSWEPRDDAKDDPAFK